MSIDSGASPPAGVGNEFPRAFYAIIRAIDRFTDVTGRIIALTMLFLMLTITYEVVMRYGFNAPTAWVYESSFMANGAAFMLGCGYALYKGAHVRTDIYWENFSERTKGIIDMISYILLFYPVMVTFMVVSYDATIHSWDTGERSQESVWRVIIWPFRATIPLAAVLLMIQGVSEVLKCWYQIQFGREFEHKEKIEI